ncbi:MAG: nicotinate phosphoribosyltransferase [Dehalococcoidia bacterium]|nr:nicotinate phosphoribosyltransferase [Dehalococcoidia bacterium]
MAQAYYAEGLTGPAVFELFVRRLPPGRNVLLAAGLGSALDQLEQLRFEPAALAYLATLGLFEPAFLDRLAQLRFTGSVRALPEGTPVFAGEPLLEVHAPLPEAQLVETYVLNQVAFQSAIASKAARLVLAAQGRPVLEFGARRAHGAEAATLAARSAYLAGFAGTSNVLAGARFGIPVAGTQAHSYIQAHATEAEALRAYALRYRETTLLVDTYDTLRGVDEVIRLARELGPAFDVRAIRIDSGDLASLSRAARASLDVAGLASVGIVASGDLDEHAIARLVEQGAPVTAFAAGTAVAVSADAPSLDAVYKLVAYDGVGRMKLSADKATLPGAKQLFREARDGVLRRDAVAAQGEALPGAPLLVEVMRDGRRLPGDYADVAASRERARAGLAALPPALRALAPAVPPYPVEVSARLSAEAARMRVRLGGGAP